MKISQVSVFIENKSGRLSDVIDFLGKNNINIRALSLADTSDFGILRLIVDNPERAYNLLRQAEFTVGVTDVVAVAVKDIPGGLAEVLNKLKKNGINVEYMYSHVTKDNNKAFMIFRFEDTDKTIEIMKREGMDLYGTDIYKI